MTPQKKSYQFRMVVTMHQSDENFKVFSTGFCAVITSANSFEEGKVRFSCRLLLFWYQAPRLLNHETSRCAATCLIDQSKRPQPFDIT